jgi:CubicO group peptidase (beta-lactamase class C family)
MQIPSTFPLATGAPEENGFCSSRLHRIDDFLNQAIEDRKTAGAISLVVRNGKICQFGTYGWMDLESKIAMQPDALFRIFSMTKPVTAVATLCLYEEGKFLLDDPLKDYLPEFAKVKVRETDASGKETLVEPKRDLTIHDLLTHTSGIQYDYFHEAWESGSVDLEAFTRELVKREPLAHHPGTRWHYGASNDVLGRLVEVASGQPYDEFLTERIFEPLGMSQTRFWLESGKTDQLVNVYRQLEEGGIERTTELDDRFLSPPKLIAGGAGLLSTTSDYLRFCLMLLNGGEFNGARILGRKTVELMRQDHLPPGHPPIEPFKFGYGLGVSVVRSLGEKQGMASIGEYGWGGMASTDMWIDPEENMVTMIMMQLRQLPGSLLTKRYKDLVYQSLI